MEKSTCVLITFQKQAIRFLLYELFQIHWGPYAVYYLWTLQGKHVILFRRQ